MADFNPISDNFNPTGPSPDISWPDSVQYESGLVPPGGTDVREFFETPDNTPYSFPAVRGAAVSVQQSLSNITFVPGTFGGMSSSIAYIRYWSKNGSGQKTAVGSFAQNGTPEDSQQALAGDFAAVQSVKGVGNVNTDVGGFFQPTGENPTSGSVFSQSAPPSRTALTTPTNTAYQSRPRQPVPTQTTSPRPTGPNIFQRLGSIFSANPGGSTAPAWQNPFFTPPAAPSPDGAVWQFLFNPEELQLSSGPDFNRAETWGVSDPANSGQPLSWRSNKNRKLTFGKVLLHGYTFGKRVDSLESGLQALFTARDGNNGSDGPPVLEFVWGQRVFGPCVIQNIQVRERAWDKGLLVNAEVSFELEQVPEWTINDGFVDVLRPGRQSTVNDPLATSNKDDDGGGDEEEKKNEPGGGGGSLAGNVNTYDQSKCQRAYYWTGNLSKLESSINNKGFTTRQEADRLFSQMFTMFGTINSELAGFKGYYSSINSSNFQRSWDKLSSSDSLGIFNWEPRKKFLLKSIQVVQNKLGEVWNNPTSCPNTAGKSAKQASVSPVRQQQPRQVSNPVNLL